MKKFTKNSSFKIIRITDEENVKLTFDTYYSWEKREYDIIDIKDANFVLDIILDNNEVDAIVIQSNNNEFRNKSLDKLQELPEYFKRRIYVYDCKQNYGIDLALNITKDQLSKNSMPMFSIVTPLYNTNIKYFEYAYKSLKEQTINDWEWVLVDDSPEQLNGIKNYIKKQKDPRIHYYRIDPTKGNIGLSKWRGNCMSNGKWLIEFDHDDILYPWCLETIKDAINQFPNDKFVYSDNSTIDGEGNSIGPLYGEKGFGLGYGFSYMSLTPTGNPIRTDASGPITNATIRHIVGVPNHFRCWEREFYFSIGGHNVTQRIADDYELIVRSFLKTKFIKIPITCYAQRFDGNNSQYKNDNTGNDGQGNIHDIQRRVRLISIYYDKAIHERLEELGLDDSKWIEGDPYETAHVYEKLHPETFCDDVFIPKWAQKNN